MAAAWALSHLPDWEQSFDITVYQLGWRLGGKGASGRDETDAWRIQEHGLHVWGGFYENAFRVMQQVYAEQSPDTGNPLQKWNDAFKKLSTVILQEYIDGKWIQWYLDLPENDAIPGTGGVIPSIRDYIALILNWIESRMIQYTPPPSETPLTDAVRAEASAPTTEPHVSFIERLFPGCVALKAAVEKEHPVDLIRAAAALHEHITRDAAMQLMVHHNDIDDLVEQAIENFIKTVDSSDDNIRRILMVINIAFATLRGIIRDGVLTGGWAAINGYEWTDWLRKNKAWQSTLDGPLVRGIYDYVFGFVKGDTSQHNLEAGTATHGVLRLFFTYKGAIFWEMQAGMGDVVFGPMYRVLRDRGVKFEFFQRVTNLGVRDGVVDHIDLAVQATTKDGREYDPLVRVNGVHAWPAHPRYEQLVEGDELREKNIDLESFWTDWTGTPRTLQRGTDFDDVILGISLGAFQHIAGEVMQASEKFRLMAENIGTVQTASVQLWIDKKGVDIGASDVLRASTAGVEPLSTWSDMSFLFRREQWPPEGPPQFLAYFCGGFPDADDFPPPPDPAFPIAQLDRWKSTAADWLRKWTNTIWAGGVGPDGKALDWSILHDPDGRSGEQRLEAQYFKVNIDPSERYVASFKNTSIYRLNADQSGLKNLFLTGDWVRTEYNAGCVEAAVMAGLACAAAVSGQPVEIQVAPEV